MTLYKLTDQDGYTRRGVSGETLWGPEVTHTATGPEDGPLCTSSWIHAYRHPLVAVFMNPIHADVLHPRMWEAEGEVSLQYGELMCGCRSLTTVRELPVPQISTEQRVRLAIGCAWQHGDAQWKDWARTWLTGEDRSFAAAWAAKRVAITWAAHTAAQAAAWRAAGVAKWAAEAEERATAWTAARTAEATIAPLAPIAEWAVTDAPIDVLYPKCNERKEKA